MNTASPMPDDAHPLLDDLEPAIDRKPSPQDIAWMVAIDCHISPPEALEILKSVKWEEVTL